MRVLLQIVSEFMRFAEVCMNMKDESGGTLFKRTELRCEMTVTGRISPLFKILIRLINS